MRQGMGGFATYTADAPDKLLVGTEVPALIIGVTLKSGQGTLVRGSVIGIVTATAKGLLSDAEAEDGSETAKYILAEDSIDTTGTDVIASCYKTGQFNRDALVFGENGAPVSLDDDLRAVGIHLIDVMSY